MTAVSGPLRSSLEEDRERTLLDQIAALKAENDDLKFQRDAARATVAEQQTEFQAWRLRPNPREPRTRTVPTGDHL